MHRGRTVSALAPESDAPAGRSAASKVRVRATAAPRSARESNSCRYASSVYAREASHSELGLIIVPVGATDREGRIIGLCKREFCLHDRSEAAAVRDAGTQAPQ